MLMAGYVGWKLVALIHDVNAPQGLRLAEVAEPVPQTSQALIEVHSVSLNSGELAYLNQRRNRGEVPGMPPASQPL
jgi:NADPH2:quinone reductase